MGARIRAISSSTTPGTKKQVISTVFTVPACIVQAPKANVGTVFIGGPELSSTARFSLSPGERLTFQNFDLNYLWFDQSQAGDKLEVAYFQGS